MIIMGIPIVTFMGIMLVIYNLLEKFFDKRGNEHGEHDLLWGIALLVHVYVPVSDDQRMRNGINSNISMVYKENKEWGRKVT